MAISSETIGRLLASGRNYASTIVGFIGGIGLMSASQQKGFSDAIGEIFNGLSQVVHGATSLWQILIVAFPIIGILMAKDLLKLQRAPELNIRALIRPAVFVPESKGLNDLLRDFRGNRNHLAIVIDEFGRVAGLITIEDVL